MKRIRKGDDVVVIAGKDKGRRGTVSRVVSDDRVLVEGLNVVKKHQRPDPNKGVPGGVVDKEMPLHISNVMLWNAKAEKGDRIGYRVEGEGDAARKVRYFKSNGEVVDG
ncbi:50S ribosomal protein L24 [Algiphilus sp.]|uniref:50S ribosomal protein L24 n=1 Tax=Algiphilus sp. TaxID=1872431 RepID=UPI001CA72E4C|nr:50S ribosomal protein L24 [Algiphilus sp.]MBY8966699.1 50S ribosomal protein L24 [Algiphilus acroporae]MCI5061780.1 50S ribosomal protein L24 [Algiphilus sp.]MCI5103031.1 50S ribosomal protein L24 [Algiphilus sp.]MCR9091497.1 50S ribosomal protein L24 [Pseudomonadota bacterium]